MKRLSNTIITSCPNSRWRLRCTRTTGTPEHVRSVQTVPCANVSCLTWRTQRRVTQVRRSTRLAAAGCSDQRCNFVKVSKSWCTGTVQTAQSLAMECSQHHLCRVTSLGASNSKMVVFCQFLPYEVTQQEFDAAIMQTALHSKTRCTLRCTCGP